MTDAAQQPVPDADDTTRRIDDPRSPLPPQPARDSVAKALDLLIEGELRLLSASEARQSAADTRMTALLTAALALPTLALSLAKDLKVDRTALRWVIAGVGAVIVVLVLLRAWGGWRRRRTLASSGELNVQDLPPLSAEAPAVRGAVGAWRGYQDATQLAEAEPIRVRQLALRICRARAEDSRQLATSKDRVSAAAAVVFTLALGASIGLLVFSN